MTRLILLAVSAVVATGCMTGVRVQLREPPSKDAPLEARRTFYEENRPVAVSSAWQMGSRTYPGTSFLILEDGTRVDDQMDLLPSVLATSATARAAKRAQQAHDDYVAWSAGGFAIVVLGAVAGAASAIALPAREQSEQGELGLVLGTAGMVGAGVIGIGGGLALWYGTAKSRTFYDETAAAFRAYDASLGERLGLSRDDIGEQPRGVAVANAEGDFVLTHTLDGASR